MAPRVIAVGHFRAKGRRQRFVHRSCSSSRAKGLPPEITSRLKNIGLFGFRG